MPSQAGIPNKGHKGAWSVQKPYTTPDDPMPRKMGGEYGDSAIPERGLGAIMPVGELHLATKPHVDETDNFRARKNEASTDDQRYGKVASQPGTKQGKGATKVGRK